MSEQADLLVFSSRDALWNMRRCSCIALDLDKDDQCSNCTHFHCLKCTYPNRGDCRRHAPQAGPTLDDPARWPQVERVFLCGDYERLQLVYGVKKR